MTTPSHPSTGPATPRTPLTDPTMIGHRFNELCNAGALNELVALYEPDAVIVDESGQIHRGTLEIRAFFSEMLEMQPTVQTLAAQVIVNADLAQSSTHWQCDTTAPDGTPIRMEAQASELFRRQPDGTWRVLIDNPWGAR
ncbi:YybH family protein [Streptomyces olivoreticuli]|uniref:YybH family protein n=1 Tax=Streptomyces olivoreticuli TaxID=68246 RepID=UPI0013C30EA5|nr:SgcJ/EcaC family oxidoreductase [Streptomyces olivoreticuli]